VPAVKLAADIRAGKVTSEQVVGVYIKRIREINPLLNHVVKDRFVQAMAEAQYAWRPRPSGRPPRALTVPR